MPKGMIDLKNKSEYQMEAIDFFVASDNSISNELSDSFNKSEQKNINKNVYKYIFLTPISSEKKAYCPSTPKKIIENSENEEIINGRNLLEIFESL